MRTTSAAKLRRVSRSKGAGDERLVGAVDLDDVHAAGGDADQQADHAGAGDEAGGPLLLEAGGELVEADDAAEAVEQVVEPGIEVGEGAEVEALQALGLLDADLGLAVLEVGGRCCPGPRARR
jgi:hypothetical protein